MKAISAILLASSFWVCFVSCAATNPDKPKAEEKKNPVEGPKLVGIIASIPSDKRFVLIQSYGKWNVESGQILTTRGPDDRAANLKTTGESLGEFAAADLQSGEVQVGDAVYFQSVNKPPALPTTTEVSQNQNKSKLETVQKNN